MSGTSVTQAELWAVLLDRLKQDDNVEESVVLGMVSVLASLPVLRKWSASGVGASASWSRRGLATGPNAGAIHAVEPVRAVVSQVATGDRYGMWSVAVHARVGALWVIPELRTTTDSVEKGRRIADTHLQACGALLLGGAA